jgi:endonuclease III
LTQVVKLLKTQYASPRLNNKSDPLDELFFILLSAKTPYYNFEPTFDALKKAYWPWRKLLSANTRTLRRLLRPVGLAEWRAKWLRAIAKQLHQDFGAVSLQNLRHWSNDDIERYLMTMPGVGIKIARCVMMYSLGRDVLPVDTHTKRLGMRLGLIKASGSARAIHQEFDSLAEGFAYDVHTNFVAHGRAVCTAQRPRCASCVLEPYCPSSVNRNQ